MSIRNHRSSSMVGLLAPLVVSVGAILVAGCTHYDPYNPDKTNLEGVWALDNSTSRQASEEPVSKRLSVYAAHMEFCPGQGTLGTEGQWRDGGFWCEAKDGSGEIQAVRVLDPENVELKLAAFYPGNKSTLQLYKEQGTDAETKALAAKYTQPIAYPPPAGIIAVGMTEFQMRSLPWQPKEVAPEMADDRAEDATIY